MQLNIQKNSIAILNASKYKKGFLINSKLDLHRNELNF